ncbi:MAG: UDP-N-acetylmuramoyl-tripeptide--D-alanyl-D-alanine ligase [Acidobacteriia bacterium]|nr:UDP-N-acetylmuramoyl-tripeptide--D-alanyl-D-alanine ligase [Terriglobia bacterium]
MQLTLREIAEVLRPAAGQVLEETLDTNAVTSGYSIDSRSLRPGNLFFAIPGPRFDGHEFVREALERGACGAVVNAVWARQQAPLAGHTSQRNWIEVQDTVAALQSLGHQVRTWWGGTVIAVTGSAGKTTTKEICAQVLSSKYRVYKSEGNLNNLFGVPLTLLRLETGAEAAVVELAMSARGEIRTLARLAAPDVGVVTNVNPVHLEFFSSIDDIGLAKRELVEELDSHALAVLNGDDARVAAFREHTAAQVIHFGEKPGADLQIRNIQSSPGGGSEFEVVWKSHSAFSCRLPLIGQHNIYNAAAAIAVGLHMDVDPPLIQKALESIRPAPMRGELLKLTGGITVINDTYNSNPRALSEVVTTLSKMPGFKRKLVVAGEMLELGKESRHWHHECGREMAKSGIDFLLAVQGDAEAMAEGAREAGMKSDRVQFVKNSDEAGTHICRLANRGDLILFKGSRGVKMERALEALRQKFPLEVS